MGVDNRIGVDRFKTYLIQSKVWPVPTGEQDRDMSAIADVLIPRGRVDASPRLTGSSMDP